MSVFDLDPDGDAALRDDARANGILADDVQPGFFDGFGTGVGLGLARGAAKAGRAAALGVGGLLAGIERVGGYDRGEITDSYFDSVVKLTDEAVDFYTPNANTVGTAGRVLGGLAEIVAPLAAGAGNPALLIGSTGLNTTYDLARQGVDPTTATAVGLVDATAVGLGFRLPFLGATLAQKAATGAATGLALGAGATAADRAILQAGGYEEIAQQYNPLDLEARTVDLLTGIAFGGIAQLQSRRPVEISRSDRDAALTGLNARHFQSETAPGRPRDEIALSAHQRALEQAIRQIQEGRPVDVSSSRVTEARFVEAPRETPGLRDPQVRAALDELGIRDAEPPRAELRPEPEAITDTPAALGETTISAEIPPGRTVSTPEAAPPDAAPAREQTTSPEPPRAETEPQRQDGERGETDDPDVLAAERSLVERDIEIETGTVDPDGVAQVVSARETLKAARQEVTDAKREAKAIEAAVLCALSFGDT